MRPKIASWIAACSVGLAAFLLFWIQPLVARVLLPAFGGNQAVWNASMVFFQSALLAGYALAAWLTAPPAPARRLVVPAVLGACAALLVAGPSPTAAGASLVAASPVLGLALVLGASIGLGASMLAVTSPLVQSWQARAGASPWPLYAWSNLGSLAALLAFPLVFEPRWALSAQYDAWSLLVPVSFLGTVASWLVSRTPGPAGTEGAAPIAGPPAPFGVRLGWLMRAAVASSLLLSVTAHMTTDIAAVPLLWVLPLVIYLAAFAWAFSPGGSARDPEPAARMGRLVALPIVLWVGAQPRLNALSWLPLAVHLVVFGIIAAALCAQLVATRPHASRLAGYYLVIAAGGLLGSAFNTFACPVLFDAIAEYPLGLVAAAFLLGHPGAGDETLPDSPRSRARTAGLDVLIPALIGGLILIAGSQWLPPSPDLAPTWGLVVVALPGLGALFLFRRPRRYAIALAAIALAASVYQDTIRAIVLEDRSSYGAFRVQVEGNGSYYTLVHGSTIHGRQAVRGPLQPVPLSYYHPTGPAGDAWLLFASEDTTSPVGVVGLGIGTMAAYAEPGRHLDFYELDPAMIALANDTRWFHYVSECRGKVSIHAGDARLGLMRRAESMRRAGFERADSGAAPYGMLVLDAFSSDGIPVHLLTREALALYRECLAPRGIITYHVSNRYLDLAPILASLAEDAGLQAVARSDDAMRPPYPGKMSSEWVILGEPRRLAPLIASGAWKPVPVTRNRPWTDDHADILGAFRF